MGVCILAFIELQMCCFKHIFGMISGYCEVVLGRYPFRKNSIEMIYFLIINAVIVVHTYICNILNSRLILSCAHHMCFYSLVDNICLLMCLLGLSPILRLPDIWQNWVNSLLLHVHALIISALMTNDIVPISTSNSPLK